ncbi:MAG: hypothetical protein GF388_08420 [Candidatus Aegiribacteria sp.]|nr:hypothetical protein [Candidatus Aegiribacteria sp.]MBD3295107.1 hypothetical protein [Candidatus Fermentibacteria bacterium]
MLVCIILLILTPKSEQLPQFLVLASGQFHRDEVIRPGEGGWMGVFTEEDRCELRPVELEFLPYHDFVLDSPGDTTGTEVFYATDSGNPLFFVWSLNSVFRQGPLPTAAVNTGNLLPDTTFQLSAEGVETCTVEATDKGLFVSSGGTPQRISAVYPQSAEWEENRVSILWAGDLDGDGRMDILLDDLFHYNVYVGYVLYLSSLASPGQLMEEAASFIAVGC